jgi:hypothetical protein
MEYSNNALALCDANHSIGILQRECAFVQDKYTLMILSGMMAEQQKGFFIHKIAAFPPQMQMWLDNEKNIVLLSVWASEQ